MEMLAVAKRLLEEEKQKLVGKLGKMIRLFRKSEHQVLIFQTQSAFFINNLSFNTDRCELSVALPLPGG